MLTESTNVPGRVIFDEHSRKEDYDITRICQRGVDGSAIPDGWIYEDELGEVSQGFYDVWFPHSRVIDGVRMGPPHRDFEISYKPAVPPIEDGTHEFKYDFTVMDENENLTCTIPGCGQLAAAPVHKVSEPPHVLLTRETCNLSHREDSQCPVCDGGLAICANCGRCESELDDPACPGGNLPAPEQSIEPPARVYVPLPYAGICSKVNRPDLPQAEYARLEPIRAAIDKCEKSADVKPNGEIGLAVDDWDALVALVKGKK